MLKSTLTLLALFTSPLALATPIYMIISGLQAEGMFNEAPGVLSCNGNTCSWTAPDQVSSPHSMVTTCSAKVFWKGTRTQGATAIHDTAICTVAQLD